MAVSIVRLGSPRSSKEGVRVGTVRRPPRGVKKKDYAKLDFFDVWLPQLAPSAELLQKAKGWPYDPKLRKLFERRYLRELATGDNSRLLDLLAALSKNANFSLGCYCEDETICHRSILRKVLISRGALIGK